MFIGCKFTHFFVTNKHFDRKIRYLRPKFFFASVRHHAATLRASLFVPYSNVSTSALQTQSPHLTSTRGSHVCNDSTNNNVLNRFTVRAYNRGDLLTKQTPPLIALRFIATGQATIGALPSHIILPIDKKELHVSMQLFSYFLLSIKPMKSCYPRLSPCLLSEANLFRDKPLQR